MFPLSVNFYFSTIFHWFTHTVKSVELLAKVILKRKIPSKIGVDFST